LETFFGAGGGDNNSLTGSGGGVDGRLSGKCTLVGSEAKSDRVVLLVNIASSTSLLMLSRRGDILSMIAKSFGEESLMKSMSQELISFSGVFRSSR